MSRQHITRSRGRAGAASPAVRRSAGTNSFSLGNLEWTAPNSPERVARRRRGRLIRPVRRLVGTALAIAVVGCIAFIGLLLATPSVGTAPELVSQLDREHHVAEAARALPARFSAALTAIQDQSFARRAAPAGAGPFTGQLLDASRRDELTLDQQLAAMLYIRGRGGAMAGIERTLLGLKLYWTYTRAEVVRMYAAVADFGRGYYGLAAASCGYFRRLPPKLSWGEMAMLAAVVTSPAADDPYVHPAAARRGQAAVLRGLVAAHVLSRADAAQAGRRPWRLARRGAAAVSSARGVSCPRSG